MKLASFSDCLHGKQLREIEGIRYYAFSFIAMFSFTKTVHNTCIGQSLD